MNRRIPYIEIYQLAYQKRLAEESYTLRCHGDEFSSLARRYTGIALVLPPIRPLNERILSVVQIYTRDIKTYIEWG